MDSSIILRFITEKKCGIFQRNIVNLSTFLSTSCRNSREMGLISSDPTNDFCAKLLPVGKNNPICSSRAVYILPDQNDEIGSTVVAWVSGDNGCRRCSTMGLDCSSDFCYCRVYFSAPFWEA